MGKRLTTILLCTLFGTGLFAQDVQDEDFVRGGLLRTFGCFAFDYRFHQNVWDYRFHGLVEYYFDKRISMIQECYIYIDSGTDFPVIERNLGVGSGLAYHWPNKNIDPYVFILSRGEFYWSAEDSLTQAKQNNISRKGFPSMAIGGGVNLYVWKYFNFFAQARYQRSFLHNYKQITDLDCLSVSFGLGFQLHTKKEEELVLP